MDTTQAQKHLETYLHDPLGSPTKEELKAFAIALIILIAFNNTLKEVSK